MPSAVVPDAEAWSAPGGPGGVLLLHGFTGSPFALRPLASLLAGAGYAVELPRLPGHGTVIEDLVPMRWEDWCAATDAAYADLAARCQRVVVVGFSMGGGLSCRLTAAHPEIAGLVLINPMLAPSVEEIRNMATTLFEGGMELVPGVGDDIARPHTTELAYSEIPLAPLMSLYAGLEADVLPVLDKLACPVLLFSSRQDHVVPPGDGDRLAAVVSAPFERVWLEESYHVAPLDIDRPLVEERVSEFVRDRFAGITDAGTTAP